MSSRAWTEVATGAEARSLSRWVWRKVVPRTARAVAVLLLVTLVVMAYGDLVPNRLFVDDYPIEDCDSPFSCQPSVELSDFLP